MYRNDKLFTYAGRLNMEGAMLFKGRGFGFGGWEGNGGMGCPTVL